MGPLCPSDISPARRGKPEWMDVPSAEAPAYAGMTGGASVMTGMTPLQVSLRYAEWGGIGVLHVGSLMS